MEHEWLAPQAAEPPSAPAASACLTCDGPADVGRLRCDACRASAERLCARWRPGDGPIRDRDVLAERETT